MIIIDVEQGGEEWKKLRTGIPSASRFKDVMAKGQGATRRKYLIEKASEILTGEMPEQYVNDHMKRGIEQEPQARAMYEAFEDVGVETTGLALTDDRTACASPDGLVGENGLIEIKSVIPTVHIETILSGKMPTGHNAQVQGNLWIWEREWCDFISFSPTVIDNPVQVYRVYRDEEYIGKLSDEVERFNFDVNKIVEKIRQG